MTPATLQPGSHGADVTVLQHRLRAHGQSTTVDGWYGADTERAVRAYQLARGLVADGLAGERTQAALRGEVDARWLTQADIEHAATDLACSVAAIQAVIEVESPRGGYLPDGRLAILFERHVFWRQLVAAGIDPTTLTAQPDILSQQRGGYVGGVGEYTRLHRAMALVPESDKRDVIATEACSLGRFQLMGYHAAALDYPDASIMAQRFLRGEAEQLAAFTRFILTDDAMAKALRTRKWPAFAKLYNGPAYAANCYDAKLAAAYARHAGSVEKEPA